MEELSGSILHVNFYNADNGYCVALLEISRKSRKIASSKAKVLEESITIVGIIDRKPYEDEEYILTGDYVNDPKYGIQFKFTSFTRQEITNAYGIISYLSSEIFPGIGLKIASLVVRVLGTDAIEKIKEDSNILMKVPITPKQREIIYQGIISEKINQDAVVYLLNHGITMDMTHKILATLGINALRLIKENPYIIMERVERFGFKKNDVFALRIGLAKDSIIRLKAVICYILQDVIYNSGNSYISKDTLYEIVIEKLEDEIAHEKYEEILKILVLEKKIHLDEANNVFDYRMYIQELELADEIVKLLKGERNPNKKITKYDEATIKDEYQKIEKDSIINFNIEQQQAIQAAFTEPLVIITGGPGTGKTTIVKAIINMYINLHNGQKAIIDEIALLAPTGRAAKRLKETTSLPAMTIHKFLGYLGQNIFQYSKYNRTNAKLLIIDESSMMDLQLAHRLFTSMHEDAVVILVGDVDQLPSVGPGQILKDLIETKEVKTIRLEKIHRQADNSSIVKLAHNINEGYVPENILEKFSDRIFISTDNEHLADLLVDLVIKTINKGKDIQKQVQILIPMYRGDCGINEINARIQNIINPENKEFGQIQHLGRIFRINDKVIQLVNRADKGIMNGDIGIIDSFKVKDDKPTGLVINYDNQKVEYTYDELEDISLAYAISVHKAQGSEFDVVIMPITSKHFIMLKRKLIYTAVTRAKQVLMLIGDVIALRNGIYRIEANRKTILKDKIIEYLKIGSTNHELDNLPDIDELTINDEEGTIDTINEKDIKNLTIDDFEDK